MNGFASTCGKKYQKCFNTAINKRMVLPFSDFSQIFIAI